MPQPLQREKVLPQWQQQRPDGWSSGLYLMVLEEERENGPTIVPRSALLKHLWASWLRIVASSGLSGSHNTPEFSKLLV